MIKTDRFENSINLSQPRQYSPANSGKGEVLAAFEPLAQLEWAVRDDF